MAEEIIEYNVSWTVEIIKTPTRKHILIKIFEKK